MENYSKILYWAKLPAPEMMSRFLFAREDLQLELRMARLDGEEYELCLTEKPAVVTLSGLSLDQTGADERLPLGLHGHVVACSGVMSSIGVKPDARVYCALLCNSDGVALVERVSQLRIITSQKDSSGSDSRCYGVIANGKMVTETLEKFSWPDDVGPVFGQGEAIYESFQNVLQEMKDLMII